MGTGQAFVKWLRPAGCVLFLGLFIVVTIFLFTAKGVPVEGYEPPHDSEYYAGHLDELAEELNTNMLPKLEDGAAASFQVEGGQVVVTASDEDMFTVRNSIIHYYDEDLFQFVTEG